MRVWQGWSMVSCHIVTHIVHSMEKAVCSASGMQLAVIMVESAANLLFIMWTVDVGGACGSVVVANKAWHM